MQWQAGIWSSSTCQLFLSSYQLSFDWYDIGFVYKAKQNHGHKQPFSLSHDYQHPDSLQLTNWKEGSKQLHACKQHTQNSTVLHMQFATTILIDNGHRIHEVLELSGHFSFCWVKFLTDNP
jgi:hypothetical protein